MNMVERKSRPQTSKDGSESYSGKKIQWTVMSVPVRFRPAVQKGGVKRNILGKRSTDCLGRDSDAGSALKE